MKFGQRGLFIASAFLALGIVPAGAEAAVISWQSGPVYSGPTGFQAIQTNGNALQAINAGGGAPVVVNPAGLNITFTPANPLPGTFTSGSPGTSDAGFNSVIDTTNFNGTNTTISNFFTGLIPGIKYQVQLFASDSRGCCNTRTQFFSDGVGNNSPTITQGAFTSVLGTFTADASTQALGLNASSANPILNAYTVREVSAPGTTVKLIDENVEGNINGWTGWGGPLSAPYLNLLTLAGDIDNPALTNATTVPNAINLLDGDVPFANNTEVGTKTFASVVHEGTYEFHVQVVNWSNAPFGTPAFGFNGLTPDLAIAPAPALGDDQIWRFLYTVADGSPIIGQPIQLSFGGSTAPGEENFGIDHVLAFYTSPSIPEPATCMLGLLGLAGLASRRRRMAV